MEVERDPQTATLGDAGASTSSNSSSGTSDGSSTSTSTTTAVSSTSNSLRLLVSKNKRTAMGKGRWTCQEHADFLIGLEKYGKDWKAIADVVKTRTTVQTRTHHQKYDKQVKKGRKFPEEPYEDDDDDGGGSGRSGRKPPRTKAIRPSRAGILISRTPVTVRGKRLLTPPAGGNGNGGGGSRGRPRSTRAASAAAAKAKAEADAAKAMAEASAARAARAVEAEARAAEADAAAAVAEAAAMGRVREEDAGEGSSDTGQTAGKEYRPEKRVKTDHLSADCDAAAAGTSSAYGRQRFSFPSSVTAPGTATPPTVAEVPPSPRKEATFTKSLWSSFGNFAAQGQPAASGEVGMEGEVGSYVGDRELSGGASAMPVKAVTEASAGVGSGFTSCQLSPFLCETFLDGFVVGGEDAEDLPAAAAAPAFSMAASSSPPTFAGGHNVKAERSGRDKQEGDDGMHLARRGSSFSSAAAATAARYNAQQLLHHQQQQQQQRLQQAQQQHQHQRRVLLSSGSAAVAAFGSLPDSTATLYPGAPFDPTATGIPIPGIGGLESFSPGGYAAGFGSMSEGNGVVGVGGGILNPFSAASTSPVFFRRSDFGGGGGVLDDKLEFPGGVGMAGVVGEGVVGSLKHNEQAFGLDKRLAAFRQQQQQRMLGQVFHFRPNSAPAAATATSMLSSSSSSFGDADAAHKLRRAAAAISPGAFDMNVDGDGSSSSISTSTSGTSKGHKQDNVATSSVFGMSSDNGSSSGGKTLSSDGLTDELAGYGSEGWPDDGMENLEQFDVLAVFAFDDHFGIL